MIRSVLKKLYVTEKSTMLQSLWEQSSNKCISKFGLRKYVFQILRRSNKLDLKKEVEEMYSVKVSKINIINMPSKTKPVKGKKIKGRSPVIKKAIVTLKEKYKIDF